MNPSRWRSAVVMTFSVVLGFLAFGWPFLIEPGAQLDERRRGQRAGALESLLALGVGVGDHGQPGQQPEPERERAAPLVEHRVAERGRTGSHRGDEATPREDVGEALGLRNACSSA